MGSKPAWSATFAGGLLGAFVLHAAVVPRAAFAQHADAGVEKAARQPAAEPPREEPPAAAPAEAAAGSEGSGVLPKVIDPTQLSEGIRARLAERAAGQHPSSLPARTPEAREPSTYRPRVASEPLRRGQARMRVQAVETDEGITLLSNRIQLSEPRLSQAVARRPAPEPEEPISEEAVAFDESPRITETHSLRPMSTRSAKAKSASGAGLGWLLWPFVLFVTTGAVVGTLWFRKKTE